MRNTILILSALIFILFSSSCGKKNKLHGPYTFENQTGETINLKMYKTLDDYASSTNPALAIRMAPGDAYAWNYTDPDEMLQKDKTFYMDWYTDDYRMSNWARFRSAEAATMEEPPYYVFTRKRYGSKIHVIVPYLRSYMRSALIRGNEKEVSWKAVNAVNYKTRQPIWDSIGAEKRDCELTIRKDHSATLRIGEVRIEKHQVAFYGDDDYQNVNIGPVNGLTAQLSALGLNGWQGIAEDDTMILDLHNHFYYMVRKK
jgi:hypothetical protein